MKKTLLALATSGAVIAALPMFAAFEAHVVNVTATIENALNVPIKFLEYGTVFPQEYLVKNVDVSLSDSFITENRVDDVEYMIRQKPKCAITTNDGKDYDNTVVDGVHAYTRTGHVVVVLGDNPNTPGVETDYPNVRIDCGAAPRELAQNETWGPLPDLCPYLSKHKGDQDGQVQETEVNAFHQPWTTTNGTTTIIWNEAEGYLTKDGLDTSDIWAIDLAVPCFGNYCAQDWASFVDSKNPGQGANASSWTQPIANEHKVFGCDLWFEVTGVSEAQPE